MKKYPSIAVIELKSVAKGILTSDTMVKHSPLSMIRSGSIHNGKYLILIGGSVASVDEAYKKGLITGGDSITDSLHLPDVHEIVFDALFGKREKCKGECIATIETRSVPSVIRAADSGIKGADVDIIEIRMADDLGGKGIVIFTGKLEEVETAINISKVALAENGSIVDITIIPRPVGETSDQINTSTSFKDSVAVSVRDGEQ